MPSFHNAVKSFLQHEVTPSLNSGSKYIIMDISLHQLKQRSLGTCGGTEVVKLCMSGVCSGGTCIHLVIGACSEVVYV